MAANGNHIEWGVPRLVAGDYGLSKRELFAALAMQALIINPVVPEQIESVNITEHAVRMADALLAELAKNPEASNG